MNELPKKIEPCPIKEAIAELRFITNSPDAVFGIIYQKIKDIYPKYDKLPITEIPESIRISDPTLKFKPYYKLKNDNFIVQIGPDVVSISNIDNYAGWNQLSKRIMQIMDHLSDLDIFQSFVRLGLRYINFFPTDITPNTKLQIMLGDDIIVEKRNYVRLFLPAGKFTNLLQITGEAQFTDGDELRKVSIIDIDTFLENVPTNFLTNPMETINSAHTEEKKLFFSLLTDEYIETLHPTY